MDDTREEIHRTGHRTFVGGNDSYWDSIGKLQFDFLLGRGLSPSDVLMDIGCGSLRGGTRFIRYLDQGNYIGVDKHIEIIIYGVAKELGLEDFGLKQPRFIISDKFELAGVGSAPNFAIAQSLFTHLTPADIALCLSQLRAASRQGCRFYATFFEAQACANNAATSHSHVCFAYTREEMVGFGEVNGWTANYIGDWSHPRGQKLMEYTNR